MVFGFRKGGKIDVALQVDRPEGPFYPGDVVHADIVLEVEKGTPVREVRAGLVFWERYQWVDRDSDGDLGRHWATDEVWVCKEILIPEGAIPDGFRQTYRFDWTIPLDAPPALAQGFHRRAGDLRLQRVGLGVTRESEHPEHTSVEQLVDGAAKGG